MFSYLINFINYIRSFVPFQINSTREELQDDLTKALANLETRISEEYFKKENLNESLPGNNVLPNSDCFKKSGMYCRYNFKCSILSIISATLCNVHKIYLHYRYKK